VKRRRTIAIVAGVVAAVLIALVVLLATRGTSQATVINSPLLGKPAPTTAGVTLKGSEIDLASYRGRPVVLNFFASWCGPCQTEAPQLNAFAYDQSLKAQGAQMIGVVFNDADSAAKSFAESQGVTYPLLTDPGGAIANRWGVASPPTTFIVSGDGKVVEELVGPVTAKQLDRIVAPMDRLAETANG